MFILCDLAVEVEVKLFDYKFKVSPQPGTCMDSCLSLCTLSVREKGNQLPPIPFESYDSLFTSLCSWFKTLKKIPELWKFPFGASHPQGLLISVGCNWGWSNCHTSLHTHSLGALGNTVDFLNYSKFSCLKIPLLRMDKIWIKKRGKK